MFDIPFKNPLEAETISERRERKARESEGSLRSLKSSARPKLSDRANEAKKVKIFRFGRTPSIQPATPDYPQRTTTNEDFEPGPAELPGSPVNLASPLYSSDSPLCVRPLSGLSFAPSASRQEAATLSASRPTDPSRDTTNQTAPRWWERKPDTHSYDQPHSEHTSSVDATRISSPIQSSRSFIAQLSRQRTERYPTVRYPSTSSTGTTSRSETSCPPGSTPGTAYSHGSPVSFSQAEHHPREYIHTSLATALSVHEDKPGVDVELRSNTVPTAVPQDEHVQPTDLHSPITPPLLTEGLPSTLLLAKNAPSKAICQRLNEVWEGTSSDISQIVDSQKKVWGLLGLRRLQHDLGEKGVVQNGSHASTRKRDEIVGMSNETTRTVLCISEDEVDGWLHAATSPQQRVSCLRPSHAKSSSLLFTSPLGVPTKFWTDMPILPYPASSIDLISAGKTPGLLRSSQWPAFVQECARVLRPGGIFEVSVIDPMPRNCGPLLQRWTAEKVILGLERRFLVTHPAMIIPIWLDDVAEFGPCESHRFSFPAVLEGTYEGSPLREVESCFSDITPQLGCEVQSLRAAVGRYFYEALYGNLVQARGGQMESGCLEMNSIQEPLCRRWWWADPAIVRECQEYGSVFEMITFRCPKLKSRHAPWTGNSS